MRTLIIANPISGGGRGKRRAEALASALSARNIAVDVHYTGAAGDATRTAREVHADCFAVVGGDGTVNEVLNGMAGKETWLAILPSGTANVVARELGIHRDPEVVAAAIAERRHRVLDVGCRGERRFLLGAGAGLDAAIVHQVSARRGTRSSLLRWVRPSLETILRYGFPTIRATVDGEVVSESAQYAIVGNCRYSAGIFPATPRARPDDGLLDVCLLHGLTPLRLVSLMAAVWRPGFVERKYVTYRQGREVALEPAEGDAAPLQIDGDPAGTLPASFVILPHAVRVITPAGELVSHE